MHEPVKYCCQLSVMQKIQEVKAPSQVLQDSWRKTAVPGRSRGEVDGSAESSSEQARVASESQWDEALSLKRLPRMHAGY